MVTDDLRDCPFFFGPMPEARGFILFRAGPGTRQTGRDEARRLIERAVCAARRRGGRLSVRLALGRRSFAEAVPRHLRGLDLSGDGAAVADDTERTIAGLFVAAPAADLSGYFADMSALANASPEVEVSIHPGSDNASGIGHGGFVDPISNLQELSPQQFDASVFVGKEDPGFEGGSYIVLRRYVEDIEMWHDLPLTVQEQIVGRHRGSSRLIGGGLLWDGRANGVSERAHVACARPGRDRSRFQWRDRLYRRSLAYVSRAGGGIEYGLHFIALCRNPVAQFKRIHDRHFFRGGRGFDRLLASGYVAPRSTALLFLQGSNETEGSAGSCLASPM